MISLPQEYIDNFGKVFAYLVRLTVLEAGVAKYLYAVSDKDLADPAKFELLYGGDSVEASAAYLAAGEIDSNANESPVEGVGELDFTINVREGGGIAAATVAQIIMLNQGDYSGTHLYDFENQQIEIWETFLPAVPPMGPYEITTNCLLRFKGVMQNVGQYDYGRFVIPCVDYRAIDDLMIPAKKLTKEEYLYVDEDVIGTVLPIVGGDFDTENQGSALHNYELGHFNAPTSVQVDKTAQIFYASDHPIDLANPVFVVSKPKDFIGIIDSSHVTLDADADGIERIRLLPDAFAECFVIPRTVFSAEEGLSQSDLSKAIDDDAASYVEMDATMFPLQFRFEQFPEPGVLLNHNYSNGYGGSIDLKVHIDAKVVGSNVADWGVAITNLETGGSTTHYPLTNADGVTSISFLVSSLWADFTWTEFRVGAMEIAFYSEGTQEESRKVQIRHIWVTVRSHIQTDYTLTQLGKEIASRLHPERGVIFTQAPSPKWIEKKSISHSSLYPSAKGVIYGVDIAATARSNGRLSSETIEQPGYFIEWLLRYRMNVPESRIDMPSFDAIGNTTNGLRKDWKIAVNLTEERLATEYIDVICKEFGLILMISGSGKYRLRALDDGTSVHTIDEDDIAVDAGKPLIEIETTPNDGIVNDLFLDFRVDYATNKTERSIYLSDLDYDGQHETNLSPETGALRGSTYTSWFEDSKSRYGASRRFQTTLECIRETATAQRSLKKLADWWAFKRIIARIAVTKTLNTLALEDGDLIKIDDPIVSALHRNSSKFIITRINYPPASKGAPNFITIEAEEVPNQYTGLPSLTGRFLSSDDLAVN